jgi:ribosomal protein L29
MKKNDRNQLKNAGAAELEKKILDARERLRVVQQDTRLGKQKNVREARTLHKDIARMLTQLHTI